jgi:tetratricopeptide (TPR) repeat protein
MSPSRVRVARGLALVLLTGATRIAGVAADVPAGLSLARAASRCAADGPLFLRSACPLDGVTPTAAAECRPDRVHGCYLQAVARQAGGEGEAAIPALRRVVESGYRLPFSATLLALQLSRQGQAVEAGAVWRRCPADDCETLLLRAGTRDTCTAAAALTNQDARASACMGSIDRQSGHPENALTWFQRAIDGMAPGSAGELAARAHGLTRADLLYLMGETELALGRLPDAKRHTLECLAAEPDHYWGGFQRGLILAAEGDRPGAIRGLERLVARYPEHGAAMMHLGMLYRAAGDRATAERWFLRARDVLPDKSLADAELRR